MTLLKIQDSTLSRREKDDNGFLIIKDNPIAKAGVFEYLLSELKEGISDADDRVVKVYRPFDALKEVKDTFSNKPIKMEHVWVGEEENQADGAIASEITVDEDNLMLKADLIIYNPELIKAIENGELVELSPAYTGEEIEQAGRYDSESYEFIQKIICVNHLAVVEKGRSGRDLRILDKLNNKLEEFRTMRKQFKDSFYKHMKKFFDEDSVETKTDNDEVEAKADEEVAFNDDARELVREIIVLSGRDSAEFAGGDEEKEAAIYELAKRLAAGEVADEEQEEVKQDEEEVKQDEEEVKQDDDLVEASQVNPAELAEVVADVTEAIVEKKIAEFQDKQRKELKQINDTYAKVSEALGTSFDYRGMSSSDIYKFGYEALTGQSLDRKMDAMTAFTMASSTKKDTRYADKVSYKSSIADLLSKKY